MVWRVGDRYLAGFIGNFGSSGCCLSLCLLGSLSVSLSRYDHELSLLVPLLPINTLVLITRGQFITTVTTT